MSGEWVGWGSHIGARRGQQGGQGPRPCRLQQGRRQKGITNDDTQILRPFYDDTFVNAGERLTDPEVDQILKYTGTEEDLDGNIKYEGESILNLI